MLKMVGTGSHRAMLQSSGMTSQIFRALNSTKLPFSQPGRGFQGLLSRFGARASSGESVGDPVNSPYDVQERCLLLVGGVVADGVLPVGGICEASRGTVCHHRTMVIAARVVNHCACSFSCCLLLFIQIQFNYITYLLCRQQCRNAHGGWMLPARYPSRLAGLHLLWNDKKTNYQN